MLREQPIHPSMRALDRSGPLSPRTAVTAKTLHRKEHIATHTHTPFIMCACSVCFNPPPSFHHTASDRLHNRKKKHARGYNVLIQQRLTFHSITRPGAQRMRRGRYVRICCTQKSAARGGAAPVSCCGMEKKKKKIEQAPAAANTSTAGPRQGFSDPFMSCFYDFPLLSHTPQQPPPRLPLLLAGRCPTVSIRWW